MALLAFALLLRHAPYRDCVYGHLGELNHWGCSMKFVLNKNRKLVLTENCNPDENQFYGTPINFLSCGSPENHNSELQSSFIAPIVLTRTETKASL